LNVALPDMLRSFTTSAMLLGDTAPAMEFAEPDTAAVRFW
jgi:hypothetical protein